MTGAAADADELVGGRWRRWRRWILVLVGLLVLGLAVSAALLVSRDYVRRGGGYGVDGTDVGSTDTYVTKDELVVPFRPETSFEVHMNIINNGPLPVTITNLPPVGGYYWDATAVLTGPGTTRNELGGGFVSDEELIPFRPFTLQPGEIRWVEWRYRFIDCDLPRPEVGDNAGRMSWDRQEVEYRLFGIPRRGDLDLHHYVVPLGAEGTCPGRSDEMLQRRLAGLPRFVERCAPGIPESCPDEQDEPGE